MPPKVLTRSTIKGDNTESELCDLLKELRSTIDRNHTDISNLVQTEVSSIRTDFQNHFSGFNEQIATVNKDIKAQSERVDYVEHVMENNNRTKRLNDTVIRGVPSSVANLPSLFEAISKFIKFNHSKYNCLNNIFRVGNRNNDIAPIVVQFTSQLFKREFMTKFIKSGPLKLSNIGINNNNNIVYVSDNLTKFNSTIHQKALQLLKNKQLTKVQTRSGFVFVQFNEDTEPIKVNKPEELPNLNDSDNNSVDLNNVTVVEQQNQN